MAVTSQHPAYKATIQQWRRCRDAAGGTDAVKAKGAHYLPMLSGQDESEYDAYKARALWYGATARTVQGLTGAVMRKPPTVSAPESMTASLADVTLTGVSIEAFATQVLQEVLSPGRYGVLVDLPKAGTLNARPYLVGYPTESIVNWRTVHREWKSVLTQVVLHEEVQDPGTDPFEPVCIEQYRVLSLDEQNQYQVQIWRKDDTEKKEWKVVETIAPVVRGARLLFIPFCFIGPNTVTPDVEKPPLLDLVDVNLSHYRSSADLEHGRHFCGLPTPWVAGFPETTTLKIGSSIAWVTNNPEARAGMLEFTGQGLGALEKALESKERLMAVLGARLLEEQKQTVEAADTLETRYSGERSVLQSLAASVSTGLTKVLQWYAALSGGTDQTAEGLSLAMNTDLVSVQMTSQMLTALMQSWQSGGISYETYYHNLQRGEIARPGVDVETERELIRNQAPATIPVDDGGGVE